MDALRSAITPITHNLPAPIRDLGEAIIGDACYKALLLDVDLENTACLKLAVSKALGIGIVAASSVVKVPQILKLVRSRSASGVSFLAYLLETSGYLISLAYNFRNGFPFSTYGETALVLGQNAVITVLVLNYSGRAAAAALFVAALAASVATLFSENLLGMEQLQVLQAGAGALSVASKLPQIVAIWQEGGTGQLSAFAVFNYFVGSLIRIFTTLQEVDDKLILYGYVAGFALNTVLAFQMLYYWNATPAAEGKEKKKEKKPVAAAPVASTSATATATATGSTTPKSKGPTTRRRG
ncbi:hypothetical protein VTJ04DRAFT_1584 [Mycothermus thermophilus]|uniref:uncharacterized protein n=1 Tax=Humicola insolens TaxID=85995 RepID=UPI00374231EF